MRKTAILLLLTGFIVTVESCREKTTVSLSSGLYENVDQMVEAAKQKITQIPVSRMKELYDGNDFMIIIDVRAKDEFAEGYIPGSVNIPRGILEFQMRKEEIWNNYGLYIPTKSDTIVLYCRTGVRSALAAESLQQLGYTNVMSLDGGWDEWVKAYPGIFEKLLPDPPVITEKPKQVAPVIKKSEPVEKKPVNNTSGC